MKRDNLLLKIWINFLKKKKKLHKFYVYYNSDKGKSFRYGRPEGIYYVTENIKDYVKNHYKSELINDAFSWDDGEEDFDFWAKIDSDWREMLNYLYHNSDE